MIKTLKFISLFFLLFLNSCNKNEAKNTSLFLKKEGSGISIQQCKNYSTKLYKSKNVIMGLTYIISENDCKTVVDTVLDVYKNYHQVNSEKIRERIFKENQNNLIELNELLNVKWNRKETDVIYYNQNDIKIIKENKAFYFLKNNKKYFLLNNKIDYIGFNVIGDNLLCFYIDLGNCCDIGQLDIYKIDSLN